MAHPCFSDIECKIICDQIERRAKYRLEFLKKRTDPCLHSRESGYVFDDALQRYMSMKTCQYDHFRANSSTIAKAIMFLTPMVAYGFLIWNVRNKFEKDCRCGRIKYRERSHKFA